MNDTAMCIPICIVYISDSQRISGMQGTLLNEIQGVPKKCHGFNRMPFPQLVTGTIAL